MQHAIGNHFDRLYVTKFFCSRKDGTEFPCKAAQDERFHNFFQHLHTIANASTSTQPGICGSLEGLPLFGRHHRPSQCQTGRDRFLSMVLCQTPWRSQALSMPPQAGKEPVECCCEVTRRLLVALRHQCKTGSVAAALGLPRQLPERYEHE